MANNPVQIVLNSDDFQRAPDPGRGGPPTDFFAGRDTAFREHKQAMLDALDTVESHIKTSRYGPAAYLKITLRPEAYAKSHRPNRALFLPDLFPCVGAGAVGTLYMRAPLLFLPQLRRAIEAAEADTTWKISQETDMRYAHPSQARSELGAIASMMIAPPEDKRNFSASDAVSLFADPATVSGYQVELFETPGDGEISDDRLGRITLGRSLAALFRDLGNGAVALINPDVGTTPLVELRLTRAATPAALENRIGLTGREVVTATREVELDLAVDRHERVLNRLAEHPLVRTILQPLRLALSDSDPAQGDGGQLEIPMPVENALYPKVGVIDTGVGPALAKWVLDRFDLLDPTECDPAHGTQVAGLITVGALANPPQITPEPVGCLIYDAALFPRRGRFRSMYPNGFSDFLEEMEQAISEARGTHGVRVFNLSINATTPVDADHYGVFAARLDQIADAYDVVIVNSAGNLAPSEQRAPWPDKPTRAADYFASRTAPDTVFQPCESVRSIAVGALNPPQSANLADAPASYTRRGPGLQVGVKPDVAAYGGAASTPSGLHSITPEGALCEVAGTSLAAPLVARTLAEVDATTQSALSTEGLRALLIHNSALPAPLARNRLGRLPRQFAGFGQPRSAAEMLETDDHAITLYFEGRLTVLESKPAILRFPFQWPASLTKDGACSGLARLTLVFSPPLDPAYGAEFVRVNLDAKLMQQQGARRQDGQPSFRDQIAPLYMPRSKTGMAIPERALIDHGLKWWPTKQYQSKFTDKGENSNWRLEIQSLTRAEARFPPEGVRFAVVMTLSDPEGRKPIFQEMRQALQASTAQARDIRTVARVRPR